MNRLFRFYYAIFAALVIILLLLNKAYAVEITPQIGFEQNYDPNSGSAYDSNAYYHPKTQNHNDALNNKIFRDSHISKAMPDIGSVGLNFTFKVG